MSNGDLRTRVGMITLLSGKIGMKNKSSFRDSNPGTLDYMAVTLFNTFLGVYIFVKSMKEYNLLVTFTGFLTFNLFEIFS